MQIFQPNLTLTLDPDGTYTLHAVTLTPSSAFSAGRARLGPPPNLRLVADVEPVMLDIQARHGMSLQVITPVKHQVHNLVLGDASGKTIVTAYALVDSRIVGQSSVASAVGTVSVASFKHALPIDTSDWYAWIGAGRGRLHVKGTIHLPTPGYQASLALAEPEADNPRSLILDLKIVEKPGTWPEIITLLTVAYEVDHHDPSCERVLVRWPSGNAILEIDELA
jgi:hypothetical protein